MCSKKFRKIYRKTFAPESLFDKVADLRHVTLFKKKIWQMFFFCEFCRLPEHHFYRYLWTTASVRCFTKITREQNVPRQQFFRIRYLEHRPLYKKTYLLLQGLTESINHL